MSTSAERMRDLRARRAAEIEPRPGAPLRDADELLLPAVEESLTALKLADRDCAAARLALSYAAAIDEAASPAAAMRHLGPLLLKVLGELGATPAARAGMKVKAPERPAPPNGISKLRAAHIETKARRTRGAGK